MMIEFQQAPVTVIVCPTDLRCGYDRLRNLATMAGINVDAGKQFVVFISKTRSICKIICADEFGSVVINRRLKQGRFERLLARVEGPSTVSLSIKELQTYLNGGPIFKKRQGIWS